MNVAVGAARITRIEETYGPNFEARTFFPDWEPGLVDKHSDWMVPNHYDVESGFLKLSVHSWLIEVGGRRILIDTCVGNHKPRPARPMWHLMKTRYVEHLMAAGVRPEQIDIVMCTHLHQDHVGWNTQLVDGRWEPTFPNARYIFSKADYDYSRARDQDPATAPANHGSFRDSIVPVVEEGLAQIIEPPYTIDEYLTIDSAPGHTPGHIVIRLSSKNQEALFSGDILHHAIQIYRPEWNSFACLDPVAARQSRRRVLECCAGSGALLAPTHFGAPFVCLVDADGTEFRPRFE